MTTQAGFTLRGRNTVEFLGIWEQVHNPNFNYGGFAVIRSQAGLNNYKLSVTGGRGAVYHLPGQNIPTPEEVFISPARIPGLSSPNLAHSSPNLIEARDADGCLITAQLPKPVIDDVSKLSPELRTELETIAVVPRMRGKIERGLMIKVVTLLCTGRFITLACLAELVQRKPDTLRDQYLTDLVRERKLALAFPATPNHARQAYTASP
jgi:hypothetical protein